MPILTKQFYELTKGNRTNQYIETGCYRGDGIKNVLNEYNIIHSIELSDKWFEYNVKQFVNYPKVNIHFGDSKKILPELLSKIQEPVTIFLDAHFSGVYTAFGEEETPLLFELEILKNRPYDDIIIIDDARLLGKYGTCGDDNNPIYPTMNFDWKNVTKESILDLIKPGYKIYDNVNNEFTDGPSDQLILAVGNTSDVQKKYEHRDDLINDLTSLIGKGKGVEIGVFQGYFSREILSKWEGTLYMVDVWRGLGDEYEDMSNHNNHSDAFVTTMKNIEGHEDRGIMIRATSKIASEIFEDESLDFVYIDANHAYDFVAEDIKLWFPKLKKGGIFAGHGYLGMDWNADPNFCPNGKDKYIYTNTYQGTQYYNGIFGVNPAVDEFCKEHNYEVNVTKEWFGTWWFIK